MSWVFGAGVASASPPAGSVTLEARIPNIGHPPQVDWMAKHPSSGATFGPATFLISDPVNGLLIQSNFYANGYGPSDCMSDTGHTNKNIAFPSQWTSFDTRTYAKRGSGCDLPDPNGQSATSDTHSSPMTAVVDPTDRVVFVPYRTSSTQHSEIVAVSETTLQEVGRICAVPQAMILNSAHSTDEQCESPRLDAQVAPNAAQQPYDYLHSLSWYAPTDDLLAITDNYPQEAGAQSGRLGVAVTDYHVEKDASGHVALRQRWVVRLGENLCGRTLQHSHNLTGSAYRSEVIGDQAVFVPCTMATLDQLSPIQTTNIVKIPLGSSCLCPAVDPSGMALNALPATAPFEGQAMLFDPQAERGYLFPKSDSVGVSIIVYDGRGKGSYLSRLTLGDGGAFGLDARTGRLYEYDGVLGMVLVDGRRTPVAPGAPFPSAIPPGSYGAGTVGAAILAPDDLHPYPRVAVNVVTEMDNTHKEYVPNPRSPFISVFADTVPLSADPPLDTVDSNTYRGTVPADATVSRTFSVNAAGYGLHSVLVGGYGGLVKNNVGLSDGFYPVQPPSGRDTIDIVAGAVQSTSVRDGATEAGASPLYDVNGNASRLEAACTDAHSPQTCLPSSCVLGGFTDPCAQLTAGLATNSKSSTAQAWPYSAAQCSQPGNESQAVQSVSGPNTTPEHSADPSSGAPSQSSIPGSDAVGARATVDCRGGRSSAGAVLMCSQGTVPGCGGQGGSVTLAGARTSTQVSPPSADGLASGRVVADAYGVHVTLPDGSELDIKHVSQTAQTWAGGTPGSARTLRQVAIDGLVIRRPGSQESVVCAGPCGGSQAVLDELNQVDPTHFAAYLPTPDQRFGVEPDGVSPAGSPGGYSASVQAEAAQQLGDRKFNQMNGFSGAETTFLPALRLVFFNPGSAQLSRQIIDLAGVESDAQLGLQVETAPSSDTGSPMVDLSQAMHDAGVTAGSDYAGPGLAGSAGGGAIARIVDLFDRVVSGLGWLLRSPVQAAHMAAFLALLAMPLAAMRRRWSWSGRPTGRPA
jgi:hypothetical protein